MTPDETLASAVLAPTVDPSTAVDGYDRWDADRYYRFYYRDGIVRDERITLARHLEFLRGRTYDRALDYGCGPTLHNAIAVAPYARAIEMADWSADNLASLRRWLRRERGAARWGHFTRYVLECEGDAAPTPLAVARREALARRTIRALLPTDARRRHPLGAERPGAYDLLVTGYCLDCLSGDRATWRAAMRNVLALVRPGGDLVLDALWRCRSYQVGDRWFPGADVDVDDLHAALLDAGFAGPSIAIETHAYPDQVAHGYPGILVATARKAARRRRAGRLAR